MSAVLADAVLLVHAGFVVFVVLGGLLVPRWPRAAWLHLPALAWGIAIEAFGWICPLTPLEFWLRAQAGQGEAGAGVVDRWLVPLLYPAGLTRADQWLLALTLVAVNLVVYGLAWRRLRRRRFGHR